MKPYRPKPTFTKIYVPTLDQLRAISKKIKKDMTVILADMIDKEYKILFKK